MPLYFILPGWMLSGQSSYFVIPHCDMTKSPCGKPGYLVIITLTKVTVSISLCFYVWPLRDRTGTHLSDASTTTCILARCYRFRNRDTTTPSLFLWLFPNPGLISVPCGIFQFSSDVHELISQIVIKIKLVSILSLNYSKYIMLCPIHKGPVKIPLDGERDLSNSLRCIIKGFDDLSWVLTRRTRTKIPLKYLIMVQELDSPKSEISFPQPIERAWCVEGLLGTQ